jgi:hypothetical protein
MNKFFKEQKKLVISALVLLVLAGVVLIGYKFFDKSKDQKIISVENPDQIYDFNPVYGNATFNILPESFESLQAASTSKLYLEFLLPKSREGETVVSDVTCSPVNVNVVYQPNLTPEQKEQMAKETSEKMDLAKLLKTANSPEQAIQKLSEAQKQIEEKYGYVREVRSLNNASEILSVIWGKAERIKSAVLIAACKDEDCSEINKDCAIVIKLDK